MNNHRSKPTRNYALCQDVATLKAGALCHPLLTPHRLMITIDPLSCWLRPSLID